MSSKESDGWDTSHRSEFVWQQPRPLRAAAHKGASGGKLPELEGGEYAGSFPVATYAEYSCDTAWASSNKLHYGGEAREGRRAPDRAAPSGVPGHAAAAVVAPSNGPDCSDMYTSMQREDFPSGLRSRPAVQKAGRSGPSSTISLFPALSDATREEDHYVSQSRADNQLVNHTRAIQALQATKHAVESNRGSSSTGMPWRAEGLNSDYHSTGSSHQRSEFSLVAADRARVVTRAAAPPLRKTAVLPEPGPGGFFDDLFMSTTKSDAAHGAASRAQPPVLRRGPQK
jgi:hypothetical protein